MSDWTIFVDEVDIPSNGLENWLRGLIVGRNIAIAPPHDITSIGRYEDMIRFKCNDVSIQVKIRKDEK